MDAFDRHKAMLGLSALLGLCLACEEASRGKDSTDVAVVTDVSPLTTALAPHGGDQALDQRIRALQQRVMQRQAPARELEQLGWLFIAHAREQNDGRSYDRALSCARAIESYQPDSHAALLLRGHALHSTHRFAEAEQLARRLVEQRGMPADYGLLGDVLIDRGRLGPATDAYQRMVDLRPDMHSYARAAHVRYLTGDLPGALQAMEMAARAASPRDRESFAWTWSTLANYQLQSGATPLARSSAERARAVFPQSLHALKALATVELTQDHFEAALPLLREAVDRAAHPDLLWMLAETLAALDRHGEAARVHAQLRAVGRTHDPRAFALYLATRREQLPLAERLARSELAERSDIYSHEALAWVQSARGDHSAALEHALASVRTGAPHARLYFHAGLVAQRAGDAVRAAQWLARARAQPQLLLPSERVLLHAPAQSLSNP